MKNISSFCVIFIHVYVYLYVYACLLSFQCELCHHSSSFYLEVLVQWIFILFVTAPILKVTVLFDHFFKQITHL